MLINLVFQVLMAMVKMVPTTRTETNGALHIIKTGINTSSDVEHVIIVTSYMDA
jgi:hypothetical protein